MERQSVSIKVNQTHGHVDPIYYVILENDFFSPHVFSFPKLR